MKSRLEEIKPIEVRGQKFTITVLLGSFCDDKERLKMPKKLSLLNDFYTGYVYLEHLTEKMEKFGGETYRKDKVIGVDTGHSYNENMAMKDKKEDVYNQLKIVIEKYLDLLGDIKKVVGAWTE